MFTIFNVKTGLDFGLSFIGVRGERGCTRTLYLLDVLNIDILISKHGRVKVGKAALKAVPRVTVMFSQNIMNSEVHSLTLNVIPCVT